METTSKPNLSTPKMEADITLTSTGPLDFAQRAHFTILSLARDNQPPEHFMGIIPCKCCQVCLLARYNSITDHNSQ